MTTYNTYEEAKIANKDKDIYYLDGLFGTKLELIDCGVTGFIYKCNPAEHCISLEDFFNAGHKLVNGDKYLSIDGSVIKVGHDTSPEYVNDRVDDIDKKCFVLSAKALEEKVQHVDWKNGDECVYQGHIYYFQCIASWDKEACVLSGASPNSKHFTDAWIEELSKPETPEQKKEREKLEAAYDLYVCWYDGIDGILTFDELKESEDIDDWVRIAIKTGYRKPE